MKKALIITVIAVVVVVAAGMGFLVYLGSPKKPIVKSEGIKIACIGDSTTFGLGVMFNHRDENSYPAQLQTLIGTDYQVLNYGVCGATLLKSGNKPYWDEKSFTYSKEANPDIVVIMLGTNDSKPSNWNAKDYELQLEEMVNVYQTLPSEPKVYLMTTCEAFIQEGKDKVYASIDANVIENEIVNIITRVADKTNTSVINIFAVTKDHPEYFMDGVHPNVNGNTVLAEMVYSALTNNE